MRQEAFDVFKTKLTSHRLQTSGIMQFAAGVRMLSTKSVGGMARGNLVSAGVAISSVVLLAKANGLSHSLIVHTQPPSSGKYNSCIAFH